MQHVGVLAAGGGVDDPHHVVVGVGDVQAPVGVVQSARLEELGVTYVNVPVVWRSPERADFEAFREAMAEHAGKHILVQCQANYRASAFTYLYRVVDGGVPEEEARQAMNEIWEPEGTWKNYVDEILE